MRISRDALINHVDDILHQLLLLFASVVFALWFANFPGYLNLVVIPGFTLIHWIAITLAIVLLLATARESWDVKLNVPLVLWWFALVTMNLTWFALEGGGEPTILFARLAALMFFAVAYLAFEMLPDLGMRVRRLMVGVVILSVAFNCYQLFNPFAFVPAGHEFATVGRTAGIYVNPNSSGAAIVLGMVLSAGLVPPRWRGWFVVFAGIGVVLTISRAAALGYFVAVAGLALTGILTRRNLVFIGTAATVLVAFVVMFLWPQISELVEREGGLERLLWFLNPEQHADFSSDERTMLAEQGWLQFLEHPILGNGVGSTEQWTLRSSTHNQYLQLMSDFGIAGALVLPAMIGTIVIRTRQVHRATLIAMGCVALFGLVSHNIYNEYFWLFVIALAAALPVEERNHR